jgi:O-antigen/teichoic acid export membrane protein
MASLEIPLKTALMGSWKLAASLISFAFTVVVANYLGSAGYGIYTLCTSIVETGFLLFLGCDDAIAKFLAEKKLRKVFRNLLKTELILGLIGFVVVFMGADLLGLWFNKPISLYLKLLSVVFLLRPFYSIFRGVFLGFKKMRLLVISELTQGASNLLITIILISFGLGLLGAIAGYVLSFLSAVILSYLMLRRLHFTDERTKATGVLKYSLKSTVFYVFRNVGAGMIILIPSALLSSSILGNLSLAYSLSVVSMGFIPVSLSQVLFPYFSGAEKKKSERLFNVALNMSLVISLPLFLAFLLFIGPFMAIVFPSYTEAIKVMPILGLAALVDIAGTLVLSLIKAKEKFSIGIKGLATYMAVLATLYAVLIPPYQIIGAAVALLLSSVAMSTVLLLMVKREYDVKFDFREATVMLFDKVRQFSSLLRQRL